MIKTTLFTKLLMGKFLDSTLNNNFGSVGLILNQISATKGNSTN